MKVSLSLSSALIGLALSVGAVDAGALPAPVGPVVLTVTGKISETTGPGVAEFDMAALEALPGRVTRTETPWTKGQTTFEGPLGSALLDRVGAAGTSLHVVALNDYAVDVPIEDLRKWPVILAVKKDGKPMPVRDKGPIFIIYPFDLDGSLRNEKVFSRSAWQVKSIEVR